MSDNPRDPETEASSAAPEDAAHEPDTHGTHDSHDAHGATGDAHGHGDPAASDASTLVPTSLSQLILPAIILIVVAILLAGPVMNAFAPRPSTGAGGEQQQAASTETKATPTPPPAVSPTLTPQSAVTSAPTVAQVVPPTSVPADVGLQATQTAVAVLGEQGKVARVPVKLEFAGTSFVVQTGSGLLPDWKPPQDPGAATWIDGTVANHVLYVPFTEEHAALFKAAKPGDIIKLTMNTGQVFSFAVTRVDRAINGPATDKGQFTVTMAMAQDHAGVTVFLTGDPAPDRAVLQADFTGNIQ